MSHDKRNFSRVATRLKGRLRTLSGSDVKPLFGDQVDLGSGLDADALRKSNLQEPVVEFLLHLNRKLDLVVSLLSQEQLDADFPVPAEITEISGAGLCFNTGNELGVGDVVEVVVVLSRFPLRMAGAIGKVVRREGPAGHPGYALDFTHIRDNDLEHIVQFVFQEQRAQIREHKWT